MLTKTMIALSAVLVLGTTSASFADEGSEIGINQTYPFLQNAERQNARTATEFSAVRRSVKPFTAAERAWFNRASDPTRAN